MITRFLPTANGGLHLGRLVNLMACLEAVERHVPSVLLGVEIPSAIGVSCSAQKQAQNAVCSTIDAATDLVVHSHYCASLYWLYAREILRDLHWLSLDLRFIGGLQSPLELQEFSRLTTAVSRAAWDRKFGVNLIVRGEDLRGDEPFYRRACDFLEIPTPQFRYHRTVEDEIGAKLSSSHLAPRVYCYGRDPAEVLELARSQVKWLD